MKGNDKLPQNAGSRKFILFFFLCLLATASLLYKLRGDGLAMSPFRSLINRDTVNKPSGKTVSPQSVVVSSITSTTNTTVTQVDTKQQHADEEDRKACGEPHRRGYISTIDVAAKDGVTITTTFCGNAAGRPLQLTKNRVHTRPLFGWRHVTMRKRRVSLTAPKVMVVRSKFPAKDRELLVRRRQVQN